MNMTDTDQNLLITRSRFRTDDTQISVNSDAGDNLLKRFRDGDYETSPAKKQSRRVSRAITIVLAGTGPDIGLSPRPCQYQPGNHSMEKA